VSTRRGGDRWAYPIRTILFHHLILTLCTVPRPGTRAGSIPLRSSKPSLVVISLIAVLLFISLKTCLDLTGALFDRISIFDVSILNLGAFLAVPLGPLFVYLVLLLCTAAVSWFIRMESLGGFLE